MQGDQPGDRDHWLVRPTTIRALWILASAVLALLVALDFAVPHRAHFGVDGWFGFGAWYGFLACVLLVLVAKGLGFVSKRSDTYYDD